MVANSMARWSPAIQSIIIVARLRLSTELLTPVLLRTTIEMGRRRSAALVGFWTGFENFMYINCILQVMPMDMGVGPLRGALQGA